MTVAVTGLLIFAPLGASKARGGAVDKSVVSSAAAEDGELERAPRVESRALALRVAAHVGARDYWVREWRRRWQVEHRANLERARTIRRLRAVLRHDGSVREAIALAATAYGVDEGMLLRKASCESHLSPRSFNRSSYASGLFQFLPSTFNSTPYARFSIWSPYANALAAGWMHRVGRGGEWVCR